MGSTPRTDEAYFKPHATMYDLAGEMKLMERELNAANERIRLLIAERDTARMQADRNYKLREEFRDLLATDDVEQGVAVVREINERIKLLEEAGDRMFEIGKRIVHQNGEDMYWIRKLEEELTEWIATKEAKP